MIAKRVKNLTIIKEEVAAGCTPNAIGPNWNRYRLV